MNCIPGMKQAEPFGILSFQYIPGEKGDMCKLCVHACMYACENVLYIPPCCALSFLHIPSDLPNPSLTVSQTF